MCFIRFGAFGWPGAAGKALHQCKVTQRPWLPATDALPNGLRTALFIVGGLVALEAMYAFAYPAWLIDNQAFTLTPLTARALSGWLAAFGLMMVSVAFENNHDRARVATPFLILPLPLLAFQASRFADQVQWNHPRLLFTFALLLFACLAGLFLARGNWRRSLA